MNIIPLNTEQFEYLYLKVDQVTTKHPELRLGQTWFNELYAVEPDVANAIRATDIDPFYKDEVLLKLMHYLLDDEAYFAWMLTDQYQKLFDKAPQVEPSKLKPAETYEVKMAYEEVPTHTWHEVVLKALELANITFTKDFSNALNNPDDYYDVLVRLEASKLRVASQDSQLNLPEDFYRLQSDVRMLEDRVVELGNELREVRSSFEEDPCEACERQQEEWPSNPHLIKITLELGE